MLAVTMIDLYPEPSWNFVFGQASLADRVGVFSLARYDSRFYGKRRVDEPALSFLRRSCKILAHETGHMFGIRHCVFFNCLMNGSNSLGESDNQPIHLCPVDLRKMQQSVGFDMVERYRGIEQFYRRSGLIEEADWIRCRLNVLSSPG
jgi:archaemetzincin